MITGDMQQTGTPCVCLTYIYLYIAEAIAEQLGLFDRTRHQSLSGQELEQMSASRLQEVIHGVRVFYRTTLDGCKHARY